MDTTALKAKILEFLKNNHKAVLSCISTESKPSASILFYAVDDTFCLYFGTKKSSSRYTALKANPSAAIVVSGDETSKQATEIAGEASFLLPEEMESAQALFAAQNPNQIYVKDAEDFVMFKVTPTHIRFIDASSGKLEMHDLPLT